jgi:hypothetical protein
LCAFLTFLLQFTRAESIYREQLVSWSKMVQKQAEQIENLRQLTRAVSSPMAAGRGGDSNVTPRGFGASGGMRSPFSASSGASTATPAKATGSLGSGASASVRGPPRHSIFSPPSAGSAASSASKMTAYQRLFPTGGSTSRMQQPQQQRTPGTAGQNLFGSPPMGSAGGQVARSTPSKAGSTAAAGGASTPDSASASAGGGSVHATPSSSGPAHTRQQQQQQQQHSTPARLSLSTEDLQACNQLLSTQAGMLEGSKKELLQLEARLKQLRAMK